MNKRVALLMALFLMLLSACGGETVGSGPYVWIDVPVDGLTVPLGQPVRVEGHAAGSARVERVELWIDGALAATISSLPMEGDLARYSFDWTPPAEGEYTIQAISFDSGGASVADSTRIFVGERLISFPDLVIKSVEAMVAGDKDGIPFCNTRVVYSNAGDEAVPSDFSIQFSFDGTPQETVTVSGGLAPGDSTEAVFVHQFSDLHYIGINLDSGNVIPETDEGNNAFAEARLCAEASAEPTLVPTVTTVPASKTVIQFWAEPPEIQAGACTTIRWHVENVQGVVFGGAQQQFDGSYQDCLCATQRYSLTVTHLDGSEEKRTVDINVTGSCEQETEPPPAPETEAPTEPPPAPEEDKTPPPAPSLAVPDNGLTISCKASQSLVWLPVDDPSSIAGYQVDVQRHSGDNNWQAVGGSPFIVNGKSVDVPVECGWYYRWRVRAVDGKGNISPWSGWWQFAITLS